MIQLKYSCMCGKRILAPVTHLHEVKPCPKCHQSVKIPGFGEPSFLLYLCSCGESLEQYASACPKCQTPVSPSLKPPAPALVAFRSTLKMKIRCACGKRLLVWAKDSGQPEICPKCQKNFMIPTISAVNVLHFICDCGNYLSLREEICGQCNQPIRSEPSTLPSPVSISLSEKNKTDSQEINLNQNPSPENLAVTVLEEISPQTQQVPTPSPETFAPNEKNALSDPPKNLEDPTSEKKNAENFISEDFV